jgi:hypothetical protein
MGAEMYGGEIAASLRESGIQGAEISRLLKSFAEFTII